MQHIEENLEGRISIVLVTLSTRPHVIERTLPSLGITNSKCSMLPGVFINHPVPICKTLRLIAVEDVIWMLHLVARHFEWGLYLEAMAKFL